MIQLSLTLNEGMKRTLLFLKKSGYYPIREKLNQYFVTRIESCCALVLTIIQ